MKLYNMLKSRMKECDFSVGELFACFSLAFIIASIVFVYNGDFLAINYVRQYPLWLSCLITGGVAAAVFALSLLLKTKALLSWGLIGSGVWLCVIFVYRYPENIFFCIGISLVLLLICKYAADKDKLGLTKIKFTDKQSLVATLVLVIAFTAVVFAYTAAKYKSFYHSAFDFGIFCQMFENMAETGLPYTTVERSEYLSHFAVHFSPFFYILLPGYFVWRSPLYLLFVQALGVALGAFPVRRICKKLGLSNGFSVAAAALYLLFPTMANGCFCDFHENKFLAVLILWAVYFALCENKLGTGIFCFLILTVKEDAFIYVIAICLWMIVTKRNRLFALAAAAFSVGWFFFACNMIELSGGEIMSGRFSNYVAGQDGGLMDAVRTCFIDIGYLFKEVFAGADTEAYIEMTYSGQKLEFVLWTAGALLFTPFLRKRPSELLLLIPLLVVNLMPNWLYQYNVNFQYTYGTASLLIVSALLFFGETTKEMRRFTVISALCVSLVFSSALILPKMKRYSENYEQNREKYDATAKALEEIPADATVTAYGYFVPHLWYVKDLHTCPEYYAPYAKTDYYIVDTRYDYDGHTAKMFEAMGEDYELVTEEGFAKIYRLKD